MAESISLVGHGSQSPCPLGEFYRAMREKESAEGGGGEEGKCHRWVPAKRDEENEFYGEKRVVSFLELKKKKVSKISVSFNLLTSLNFSQRFVLSSEYFQSR